MKDPRDYWWQLSDELLEASAAEYRASGDEKLISVADEIDDDLARRVAKRKELGVNK